MRHIIQARPPIIAAHPSTGSHQIAPDIGSECKARFVRAAKRQIDGSLRPRVCGWANSPKRCARIVSADDRRRPLAAKQRNRSALELRILDDFP
jgi:hypothetical protein